MRFHFAESLTIRRSHNRNRVAVLPPPIHTPGMNKDYERIATIIDYLDQHHMHQPSVGKLASVVKLSESRLHLLFQRWAGITPKSFLKSLTIEHAKSILDQSASVLDAAIDSGLSGPGRLHDLFVTMTAISPGEYKTRGAGLEISVGSATSPFGTCVIGWTTRGICHLEFVDTAISEILLQERLPDYLSNAEVHFENDLAAKHCEAIFGDPGSTPKPLKLLVHGTSFQLKVWQALLKIPSGQLLSYRDLAGKINSPNASRAVGTACGSNSIAFLIPCHRVIQQTGIVTGYRWGEHRKKALLAYETGR